MAFAQQKVDTGLPSRRFSRNRLSSRLAQYRNGFGKLIQFVLRKSLLVPGANGLSRRRGHPVHFARPFNGLGPVLFVEIQISHGRRGPGAMHAGFEVTGRGHQSLLRFIGLAGIQQALGVQQGQPAALNLGVEFSFIQ